MSDSQQQGAVLITGANGGTGRATTRALALALRGFTAYAGVRGARDSVVVAGFELRGITVDAPR
ncbi:hypothetical protein [Kribbella sp. NPDC055071]